jgi:Cys-rich protein (TIGR01571 family)
MVSVVAPSNLPEGYTLDAIVNGQSVKVTIPPGGVKEGQEFTAPVVSGTVPTHNIPRGSWRDGLCNCFAQGPCHPSLCLTFWCAPLALAQVMTRMKLNWCGQRKGDQAAGKTCLTILLLFCAYIVTDYALDFLAIHYAPTTQEQANNNNDMMPEYSTQYWIIYSVRMALRLIFIVYMLLVSIRTRKFVRDTYDIPEQQCGGCEDCCCSYWCSCCTISQMSRHTADYDTYPSSCCTSTGLKQNAPAVLV